MSLFADVKMCGICYVRAPTGQGKAIFTAECSHSFHFSCISSFIGIGNSHCPTCNVKWNDLPFPTPLNPFANNNNNTNRSPFNANPFQFSTFPTPPVPSPFPQYPTFEAEPTKFNDDDPLLAPTSDENAMSSVCLHIKATPERPAVLASEPVSLFPVLVGLKAPLVSNGATDFQRAPVDLVTVLDVSGSMSGHKLDLVKRAVFFVIDNLGPSDRLSIVSFSTNAQRISRLRRMTESGRENAKQAVGSLYASGGTNIVEGLKKGVRVLEERHVKNPVSSIMFLSDGNDTCHHGSLFSSGSFPGKVPPEYLNLLPVSIRPRNSRPMLDESFLVLDGYEQQKFPVHSFGFGSDHDPVAMHAISDSSGGTFSFIQSFEMVQDAFANCIGGLLSVVIQELRLTVRAASHGVGIKSIPSGRYVSNISNNGSEGVINVGDMYAEEDRQFLVYLSIPVLQNRENDETEGKTSLLDVMCSYKDVVTKEIVEMEADLVEIRRPKILSPVDMVVNVEVDCQKNRVLVAESIAEAQKKAELGDLFGARAVLSKRQSDLVSSVSGQAGDSLCSWLGAEIKETQERMGNMNLYQQSGRAFALSGMSSHVSQRATTRGNMVPGSGRFGLLSASAQSASFGAASAAPAFGAYSTPFMQQMVHKSQQQSKTTEGNSSSSSSSSTPMEE